MSVLKKFRVWAIALAALSIILGLVMVIWPKISALAVCCILGTICAVMGISELVRYFRMGPVGIFFRYDLALGLLGIIAGLLLLFHPSGAMALLPIVTGVYIIVSGIFDIQTAVEMRRCGERRWWITMLLGAVTAVLGLLMVIDPFRGASAIMIFIGISLIISGTEGICAAAFAHGIIRGSEPIEVECSHIE